VFQFATVQMKIAAVEVDAAQSVVVPIPLVNSPGFVEFGTCFAAKLLESIAVRSLAILWPRSFASSGLTASGCISISFAAQLQRDQALD
jgi:hypothetical protein